MSTVSLSDAKINLPTQIKDFVTAFSEKNGYSVSYLSNIENVEDAHWIGLSDAHGASDVRNCNTLLAKYLLNQNRRSILREGEGLASEMMLDKLEGPGLQFTNWDTRRTLGQDWGDGLGTLSNSGLCTVTLGKVLQRILYVAKRDLKIPFHKRNAAKDSFFKIRENIKQFVNLHEINNFLKTLKKADRSLFNRISLVHSRDILPFLSNEDLSVNPHALIRCVDGLCSIFVHRNDLLMKTTWKFRQKDLCNAMESTQGGGFILAGQDHLIQQKKGSPTIEKTLDAWFQTNRKNYLIFYNSRKQENKFSSSTELLFNRENIDQIDFGNLKKGVLVSTVMCLLPWEFKTAQWIISQFYEENGQKKEGPNTPKKQAGLMAHFFAHQDD
ncbi:MAG: hypothetical protein V4487_07870 [Chlamydiota bacterium]